MKNFKELLIEAHEQAGVEKAQRQTIILSLVLLGIFLYFIWGDNTPGSPSARLVAVMIVMFVIFIVSCVIRFLFPSILPIGKVKIKAIRRTFSRFYFQEISKFEEHKSDIEKNIIILKEKQIPAGKFLDEKLYSLEMLLDYQKTLDETSEGIKVDRYMSLQEPLDLIFICISGISFLDSESELQAAINQRSKMLDLIKSELKEEEDRLIRTNEELQLFRQKVDPYVRPTEANPGITSYIR